MSIDTKLKGDEDGLINLSIGVLVAVLSTSEAVGGVEDGDTLLVAQVWVGPSGGCRTYCISDGLPCKFPVGLVYSSRSGDHLYLWQTSLVYHLADWVGRHLQACVIPN